jgi:hypothetical protein
MSAQRDGNDVTQGELKSQQKLQMIDPTKFPIVEIMVNKHSLPKSQSKITERG